MPKSYLSLLSFFIITGLSLNIKNSFAQQVIKLNDVAKFELVIRKGGLSGGFRRVEVILKNDKWISYQTKRKGYQHNDSSEVFIKNVPSAILDSLLSIIAKSDTGIHLNRFNISTDLLISKIDSLHVPLKPAQKNEFIAALHSKEMMENALEKTIKPSWVMMDDRNYYGITITDKNNVKFTISALSFAGLYYLPWQSNNIKNYDPAISIIFEFILGNDSYAAQEKQRLHLDIDRNIYYDIKSRFLH